MYNTTQYLNIAGMCAFLGIGRNTCLRLCQERTANFPVVKVGNRYQSDAALLAKWKQDWYDGKFEIN